MIPAKCPECNSVINVVPEVGTKVTCLHCGVGLKIIEINEEAGRVYLEPDYGEEEDVAL